MMQQYRLDIATDGRGTINISRQVDRLIQGSGITSGLCHIFIQHTSASLIITENADSDVRRDLENFLSTLVIDGDSSYVHDQEGPDDMPAHIRSVLTQSELSIPITKGCLALGTWQGIFLWEHRYAKHKRTLIITVSGSNT